MDMNTFGDSNAAYELITRLRLLNSRKITAKTGRFLSRHFALLKSVNSIVDYEHRIRILAMVMEDLKISSVQLPDEIRSRVMNIAMVPIKTALRKYAGVPSKHDNQV